MTWWHRNPSWARAPIHRYAQRTLRDHEATLRARCFSKLNSKAASHKDDGDKRPSGMSNLEWMQLQHHRRWKQRFEDDPYKALFGASESMLNGKGLSNWKWVRHLKTFPDWMVKEMGLDDVDGERSRYGHVTSTAKREDVKKSSTSKTYPEKIDVTNDTAPKEHKSLYPEPASRAYKIERHSGTSGTDSPSDSRRPREQPTPASFTKPISIKSSIEQKKDLWKDNNAWKAVVDQAKAPADLSLPNKTSPPPTASIENDKASRDATARETSFIEEFLADEARSSASVAPNDMKKPEWRKTSLEQRATPDFIPKPRRRTNLPIVDVTVKDASTTKPNLDLTLPDHTSRPSALEKANATRTSQVGLKEPRLSVEIEDFDKYYKAYPQFLEHLPAQDFGNELLSSHSLPSTVEGKVKQAPESSNPRADTERINSDAEAASKEGSSSVKPAHRSEKADKGLIEPQNNTKRESEVKVASLGFSSTRPQSLDVLPEDDIDFLSAEDVRASMGRVKTHKTSKINRNESRKKLEKDFDAVHNEDNVLHPLIESMIRNNQSTRRTAWQMQEKSNTALQGKIAPGTVEELLKDDVTEKAPEGIKTTSTSSRQVSLLESGLEFMMKWLHTGGDILTRSFLQDPVDVLADQNRLQAGVSSDPFFKGIVDGVQKSRRASWQVKFDLEEDISASEPLIERLTNNEKSVMIAAGIINGSVLARTSNADRSTEDRVRVLKRGLLATDEEFKKACVAVDLIETLTQPSEALARRLRIAADVLRKNAKLTRVMIFGLQTRLESSAGQPSLSTKDLAHRLLALQDTQLALARLVSRRMHVIGISPTLDEESVVKATTQKAETTTTVLSERTPSDIYATTADQAAFTHKRLREAQADERFAAEVNNIKTAMEGLSDDGYSRSPKPVVRKSLDMHSPLAHSLFRPFGLQLESLGSEAKFTTVNDAAIQKNADQKLVNEVKKAYEDVYGPITVEHRQVPGKEVMSAETGTQDGKVNEPLQSEERGEADMSSTISAPASKPRRQISVQLLKEDEVSPTVLKSDCLMSVGEQITTSTTEAPRKDSMTALEDLAGKHLTKGASDLPSTSRHPDSSSPFGSSTQQSESTSKISTPPSATTATIEDHVPEYRIYCHDPTNDELIISPCPPPSSNSTTDTIPYHTALTTLSQPSKFIPHLPPQGYEVIAASADMLIMRSSHDSLPWEDRLEDTVRIPLGIKPDSEAGAVGTGGEGREWQPGINPIDGTTRLSPTGFSSSCNPLELERNLEFEERRKAAGEHHGKLSGLEGVRRSLIVDEEGKVHDVEREWAKKRREKEKRGEKQDRRGRVGVGGVVKTAILAGAWCYCLGVVAELIR